MNDDYEHPARSPVKLSTVHNDYTNVTSLSRHQGGTLRPENCLSFNKPVIRGPVTGLPFIQSEFITCHER